MGSLFSTGKKPNDASRRAEEEVTPDKIKTNEHSRNPVGPRRSDRLRNSFLQLKTKTSNQAVPADSVKKGELNEHLNATNVLNEYTNGKQYIVSDHEPKHKKTKRTAPEPPVSLSIPTTQSLLKENKDDSQIIKPSYQVTPYTLINEPKEHNLELPKDESNTKSVIQQTNKPLLKDNKENDVPVPQHVFPSTTSTSIRETYEQISQQAEIIDKVQPATPPTTPELGIESTLVPEKTETRTETVDKRFLKISKEISSINSKVEEFSELVNTFSEAVDSPNYYYIDENLTRNLLKLDKLSVDDSENLRLQRREVIKHIYKLQGELEEKATKQQK